jgi:hypothetical protein
MPFRLPGRRHDMALPDDQREGLGIRAGQRVLAAAPLTGGGWVAASEHALHLSGPSLPWYTLLRAAWDRDHDLLTVESLAVDGLPGGTHLLPLDEPGRLPELVRERVTASIVMTERVQITDRRGVRVVARRVPGSTELTWQVVLDEGLDPRDPVLAARAHQALADVRARAGL